MQVQRGHKGEVGTALLPGLRAGSSPAWARLYDQLGPGIHRFAVSCLSGDAETAEEVVVETLAQAASGIARFDPQKSSLSAWVYGIARHRVQAELRWCRRRKSVPAWAQVSFEDLSELADSHDLGERTAARLDAQRRVGELTGLLSDSETEVLELSAVEELSREEIGRVVGRSEQATRALLKRAKQKVRRTAIEGTLVVNAARRVAPAEGFWLYSHLFSGGEDQVLGNEYGAACDLSPASDEIAYCLQGSGVQEYPPLSSDIWKAKRDGSEAVNLSEAAGLGGINEMPRWSPDGTLISFTHWGRPGGWLRGPGETWVMKADGSAAQRVTPTGSLLTANEGWSTDGACLLCKLDVSYDSPPVFVPPVFVDLWGRRIRVSSAPPPRGNMESSPDGTLAAYTQAQRGHMEGEPGYWRQLVVVDADGARPRVLVEQFIADAQLDACSPTQEELEIGPAYDWRTDVLCWAGPHVPRWSPRGDKIAFLAALPFNLEGMAYNPYVDAWVYDLATHRLTKITNAPHKQRSLSWR